MYCGTLYIYNIPTENGRRKVSIIEITNPKISEFKNSLQTIFETNGWDISSARFEMLSSCKLLTFEQIKDEELVFTRVNVFLNLNI
jgi:hypothetical protein